LVITAPLVAMAISAAAQNTAPKNPVKVRFRRYGVYRVTPDPGVYSTPAFKDPSGSGGMADFE
jgi:hypothetical protein